MTATEMPDGFAKPINLRIIFILNALTILLTFGFFVAFKFYGFSVKGLEGDSAANLMLMCAAGYIAAFAVMVWAILNRNMVVFRIAIVAYVIVSIPPRAPIGILVAVISMALSFTPSVKAYFGYRSNS